MKAWTIEERDGTEWGTWTAETAADAVDALLGDIALNPDRYCGEPDQGALVVTLEV